MSKNNSCDDLRMRGWFTRLNLWVPVESKTFELIEKAIDIYKLEIEYYPYIKFDLNNTVAGRTNPDKWEINYNYVILFNNPKEFINITPAHEVAHLVEWKLYGKCGHKKNWREIMSKFGVENPSRCHNYKLPR